MPSLSRSARSFLASGLLAVLACGLAAGDARAVPIPTRITYSTSGPDSSQTSSGLNQYEFRPVTDGLATLGTDLKLGTIFVHRPPPQIPLPTGDFLTAEYIPIEFRVTKVGEESVTAEGASIRTANFLHRFVQYDGTIAGRMEMFVGMSGPIYDSQYDPIQVGPLSLTLKPVAVPPTWDQRPDQEVVAVDVYARLEAAPVPEPSALLIFAAAAGFGWARLRSPNSRRS